MTNGKELLLPTSSFVRLSYNRLSEEGTFLRTILVST